MRCINTTAFPYSGPSAACGSETARSSDTASRSLSSRRSFRRDRSSPVIRCCTRSRSERMTARVTPSWVATVTTATTTAPATPMSAAVTVSVIGGRSNLTQSSPASAGSLGEKIFNPRQSRQPLTWQSVRACPVQRLVRAPFEKTANSVGDQTSFLPPRSTHTRPLARARCEEPDDRSRSSWLTRRAGLVARARGEKPDGSLVILVVGPLAGRRSRLVARRARREAMLVTPAARDPALSSRHEPFPNQLSFLSVSP